MQVSVSEVLPLLSVLIAFAALAGNLRRNRKADDTQAASLMVKLENIANGVIEIKSELRSVREEAKELRERLVAVEQSTRSAHKRLDEHLSGRQQGIHADDTRD